MSDAEDSTSENPSFKDERSTAPYNEEKAREAFGDKFVDSIKIQQAEFEGDWMHLALLLWNLAEDAKNPNIKANARLTFWNEWRTAKSRPVPKGFIHLEHANLAKANLSYAYLGEAHLEHANLVGTNLTNAFLSRAHLEDAKLVHAHLVGANSGSARLENADLHLANLAGAMLPWTQLENADLRDCYLRNAKLQNANLDRADVRMATGIYFDSNRINLMRIRGDAPDPWSVLRRKYTGPLFFVHIILLVLFFAPWGARALYLSALAQGQDWTAVQMDTLGETIFHRVLVPARDSPIGGRKTYEIARRFNEQEQQFYDSHERRSVIWALMTGGNGIWGFGMALIVILYNGLRALLTLKVSTLRDAEERSSITPSLVEYYGLCFPLSEDGSGYLDAMILYFRSHCGRRWLRSPRWFVRFKWLASVGPKYETRLGLTEGKSYSRKGRPPDALIDCIGLYRLHQIASIILWFSLASVAFNTVDWLTSTYLWMPK